jgi:SMC interacting uncharacterized protein involved in chromosome segregation
MLKNRRVYETDLDAQWAQWKADIDVLKAKARRTEVDAMVEYDKAIDALQRKHKEAGNRLNRLKAASDEAWEDIKATTEKTWSEVKSLFQTSAATP